MSCIPKILAVKGDEEFIPVRYPDGPQNCMVIEGGGTYKGFDYLIVFLAFGHRCGYIAIDSEMKLDTKQIICHGGITFEESFHMAKKVLEDYSDEVWIGFDAGHEKYDKGCWYTCEKYFGSDAWHRKSHPSFNKPNATHKTYIWMENECKAIIDQLTPDTFLAGDQEEMTNGYAQDTES